MTKQLDPYHLQIVVNYLESKVDFINVILINKKIYLVSVKYYI